MTRASSGRTAAVIRAEGAITSDIPRLPVQPHIRIRVTNGWAAFSPQALWSYRELLYFLTWRDLKVRYAQTALGARGPSSSRSR